MLSKGTNAYPPSDYHARKHITDEEATLLKEETVKCRNLCSSFKNATNYHASAYASLKPNTTYFFSSDDSTCVNVTFKIYDLNGNLLQTVWTDRYSNLVHLDGFDFTTNSSVNGDVRLDMSLHIRTSSMTWVMLNEGSIAQPYSEYYGELVHTKDIDPVLLWENPNPNSAYSGDVLTIPTLPNYKYLVIQFKTGDYEYTMKLPRGSSNNEFRSFLQSAGYYNSNYTIGIRMVEQQPSTQTYLYIGSGANQTTVTSDNNMCVPTKIYGTNIL